MDYRMGSVGADRSSGFNGKQGRSPVTQHSSESILNPVRQSQAWPNESEVFDQACARAADLRAHGERLLEVEVLAGSFVE